METYYVCEDSLEGILTGVYEAYQRKMDLKHTHLCLRGFEEYTLFSEYIPIERNDSYAGKVVKTLRERMGDLAYQVISEASFSFQPERADAIFQTIVIGITGKMGIRTLECLTNDSVRKVSEFSRNVAREQQHLFGFVRFEELESGILYGKIGPKNNQLPLLMPHFANRLPMENFMLYDERRGTIGLHKAGMKYPEWILIAPDHIDEAAFGKRSEQEMKYQECFTFFCHKIAIESRINSNLQRNMLPLRFREYMTEFVQMKERKED